MQTYSPRYYFTMYQFSPSGKRIVPSVGPLDAEIVLVAESPAQHELLQGIPLVGPSGKLLNKGLVHVGIDRSKCRIINLIPVRAPGDKFANHDPRDVEWGREIFASEISQLRGAKVFIALGANPLEWLLGGKPPVINRNKEREDRGFISAWRGSVIPVNTLNKSNLIPEQYLGMINLFPVPKHGYIVPTFHPSAVLRQFNWHPWFLMDLQKAASLVKSPGSFISTRTWYRNDPEALMTLANSDVNLISYDTELDPWIVGIATEDEVHVFEYGEQYRRALNRILTSHSILKVAHRWLHDFAFTRKCLEIDIEGPLFDSVGGAMALNGALQKELSPHISTRFTNWPYHKWLSNVDQLHYCGMDAIVTYDSYWPMLKQMADKGLVTTAGIVKPGEKAPLAIVDYDHKLLMPLMQMQAKGFRIDESERVKVEGELDSKLAIGSNALSEMVKPIVAENIKRFKKPHLFQVPRKCECCGGGAKQKVHCQFCSTGKNTEAGSRELCPLKFEAIEHGFKTLKAYKESWVSCVTCKGTGKIIKSLDFNPDSPDQVADIIYRGLKIRPRKFKGKETIKAAQLDPLRDKHPIINAVVDLSELRADYDTVARLKAGADGLLHCEFDPWGTESGRVAGKEGLIEYGTNPMNLPKEARRFVIPRDGYEFIYPDMAQIEARAMAVLSKDKNLHKALYEVIPDMGKPDYHTWLQRAIHDYDNQVSISRDQSKRVSYAGFYGARPEQLAKELTAEAFRKGDGQVVSPEMATRILQTLYRVCPEVPRWQGYVCDEVLRTRQLLSPTGRVFHWVGYISDKKSGELDYEIRKQVWSRLPQDMGAFTLGLGLIDIYYTPSVWGNVLTPLIHVHDALLIEAKIEKVEVAKSLAVKMLSRYIWGMDFPAEVSNKVIKGTNWYVVS